MSIHPEDKAFIVHDNTKPDKLFIDEIRHVFSSSVTVKKIDISNRVLHSPLALPWIEVALIFASTTIATSILTKIGEDIYSLIKKNINRKTLKQKIISIFRRNNYKAQDYPTRITISINCNNLLVQGRCISNSYPALLDALSRASQMVQDAELRQMNQLEMLKKEPFYSESEGVALQTPVFKEGLWFVYEYDFDQTMWILKSLSLHKPNPESGGYYCIAGEPDKTRAF